MTEAEFSRLVRSGSLSGMYFLCGDEDYLKNRYIISAVQLARDSDPMADFNIVKLDFGEGECRLGEIESALASPPLMAEKKLVVLSFSALDSLKQKERDALLSLLSDYSDRDDTTVIIKASGGGCDCGTDKKPTPIFRAFSKLAETVRFEYQSPSKLYSWLSRHAAEYGLKLSPAAAEYMMNCCGRSMYTLSGEIEKVSAYCAAHSMTEIDVPSCMLCCSRTDEDDAFGLANALIDGDTSTAYSLLGVKMRMRQDPYMLLGQISKTFSDLCAAALFIRDGRDVSDLAKSLKIHEFRARLYFNAAKKSSHAYFMHAVELCLTADRNMKTMSRGGYGELELLVGLLSPTLFTPPEPEEDENKEEEE